MVRKLSRVPLPPYGASIVAVVGPLVRQDIGPNGVPVAGRTRVDAFRAAILPLTEQTLAPILAHLVRAPVVLDWRSVL